MRPGARAIVVFVLLNAVFAFGQQANVANPDVRMVDVGGHRLRMVTAGSGLPTVILEGGVGDSIEPWSRVLPQIASFTRVVAYERAGDGKSEPGPKPRSYTQVASELHTLLQRAGIAPPYVLVGHSLGGPLIRGFQHTYPNDVVGLVFVDPFPESVGDDPASYEGMKREQGSISLHGSDGSRGEFEFMVSDGDRGFSELRKFVPPPELPISLLIATRERPPHWGQMVSVVYEPWVMNSPFGKMVVTSSSRHYIQLDEPGLVVEAIRGTVFPNALAVLSRSIQHDGIDVAIRRYRDMKQRYPADLLDESTLNSLGYAELYNRGIRSAAQKKNPANAIRLFTLNAEQYPTSANVYDSLGEAYMVAGDHDQAAKNFRKSLEIDPRNPYAAAHLKQLESSKSQ